ETERQVIAQREDFHRARPLDVCYRIFRRLGPAVAYLVELQRQQGGQRRIVEREVIPVLMVIRQHPGATAIENAAQRAPVLGVVIGNALANFRRDQTERIKTNIEVNLVTGKESDIRTGIKRATL